MNVQFVLGKKCNCKCWYCEQKKEENLNEQKIYNNFEKMLFFLEQKLTIDSVDLLGGEISIFNDDFLKKILEKVNKYRICIFTNGIIKNKLFENLENVSFFEHIVNWEDKYICKKNNTMYMYLPEPGKYQKMKEFYLLNGIRPSFIKIKNKILKYSKEEYKLFNKFNHCGCNMFKVDCCDERVFKCCDEILPSLSFEDFFKLSDKDLQDFITPINENTNYICQECRKYKISDLDPEIQEDILKNNYWFN